MRRTSSTVVSGSVTSARRRRGGRPAKGYENERHIGKLRRQDERERVEDGRRLVRLDDVGPVDEPVAEAEALDADAVPALAERFEEGEEVVGIVELLERPEVDPGLLDHGQHVLELVAARAAALTERLDVPRGDVEGAGRTDGGDVLGGRGGRQDHPDDQHRDQENEA